MQKVIAVVPTLNEEDGIPIVIDELKHSHVDEIVVIDGHSADSTVQVAKKLGANVIMQEGRGKGMAFRTFLKNYQIEDEDKYVLLDGDASYSGLDAQEFIRALDSKDIVFGNRGFLIYDFRSFVHAIGGGALSAFASLLFLRYMPDVCCGYIGFRGKALKKLLIRSTTFTLEANIFAEAVKKGFSTSVVTVSYRRRLGTSKLTVFDGVKIFFAILRERFM